MSQEIRLTISPIAQIDVANTLLVLQGQMLNEWDLRLVVCSLFRIILTVHFQTKVLYYKLNTLQWI